MDNTQPIPPPDSEPTPLKTKKRFLLPIMILGAVLLVAIVTTMVLYFTLPRAEANTTKQTQTQVQSFEQLMATATEKRNALQYEEALALYTQAKDAAVSEGKDEMQIESIQYEIDALKVQIKDAAIENTGAPEVPLYETEEVDDMTIIRPAEIPRE